MKVAIFDFDGTLSKEETFPLMMEHLKQHKQFGKNYGKFYRSVLPIYLAYKIKLYPKDKMRTQMMQRYLAAFGPIPFTSLKTFFQDIAKTLQDNLNQEVLSCLQQHHRDGIYTILLSGAFKPLLTAVTKDYPFDLIIGTEIPVKDQKLDLSHPIDHIQGQRKNEYLLHALADKSIDWENSFAYGDSYSDLSVLELVGHPVAVTPDKKLQAIAEERKWRII